MPQYMLSIYFKKSSTVHPQDQGRVASEIDALNERIRESGAWVYAAGLGPIDQARAIMADEEGSDVADGPVPRCESQLAGFWILDAGTEGDAIVWAEHASRILAAPVEVRPLIT